MLRLITMSGLALFLLAAHSVGAVAQERFALVIGNSQYKGVTALPNPARDAKAVGALLQEAGFEVTSAFDLDKSGMSRAIRAFTGRMADKPEKTVTLIYFAGHGVQVEGENYLVPVDATIAREADIPLESMRVGDMMNMLDNVRSKTRIVFLDACRNNPFARSLSGKARTRGVQVSEGLAQIDSLRGSFIAFSTAPGSVAMDGSGRNSPFASALLRHIGEPGQSINDLMIEVRRDVLKETRDFQNPMSWDSLTNRFAFASEGARRAPEPSEDVESDVVEEPLPSVAAVQPHESTDLEDSETSVTTFLTGSYLSTTPETIEQDVDRMFLDQVISFGTVYTKERLTRVKKNWFRKYKSWKIELVPGSLTLDPSDGGRVIATFFINYVYERRAGKPLSGRSGVRLELVPNAEHGWRIASEQAFP